MPDELLDRFRHGDRLALARLLTQFGRGESAEDVLRQLGSAAKPSRVVARVGEPFDVGGKARAADFMSESE